jgi:hypothetical protein
MSFNIKNVLREIRGIPKPEVRRSLLEDLLAQTMGDSRVQEIHQSQVNIVHKREYEAQMKELDRLHKIEIAEQERQRKINEVRLQNLKKARRKLKRLRGKDVNSL